MAQISYLLVDDFSDDRYDAYLELWASKTQTEYHMLRRTIDFFKDNLLCACFAFDGELFIGAAGLIPCLRINKTSISYKGSLVVELGSNFVDPKYRNHGIGTEFVMQRLNFAWRHNYLPVSVTGNEKIKKIFNKIGGCLMEDYTYYDHIRTQVRVCECLEDLKPCGVCPLKDKAIWVFENPLK